MKTQTKQILWEFGLLICIFILGFSTSQFLSTPSESKTQFENKTCVEGLWTRIRAGEEPGEWVSINIENMDIERALEVCQHEVGHSIYYKLKQDHYSDNDSEDFAEICEADFDKCLRFYNNEK